MTKLISKRGREKAGTVSTHRIGPVELEEIRKSTADAVYFITNHVRIDTYMGVMTPTLGAHHLDYLTCLQLAHSTIATMPRQSGTTTVTMAFMLWMAMFTNNQKIIVQGINVNSTKIMCDILNTMVTNLPHFFKGMIKQQRRTIVEFINGSHISVSVASATALRGVTYSYIFLDNFAMLPPLMQRDLWVAIAPAVAFNGRCVLASVPNGRNNTFFQIWEDAVKPHSVFSRFKRTADDLPYTDAWKKMVRMQIGEANWRKEYMCEFV